MVSSLSSSPQYLQLSHGHSDVFVRDLIGTLVSGSYATAAKEEDDKDSDDDDRAYVR